MEKIEIIWFFWELLLLFNIVLDLRIGRFYFYPFDIRWFWIEDVYLWDLLFFVSFNYRVKWIQWRLFLYVLDNIDLFNKRFQILKNRFACFIFLRLLFQLFQVLNQFFFNSFLTLISIWRVRGLLTFTATQVVYWKFL